MRNRGEKANEKERPIRIGDFVAMRNADRRGSLSLVETWMAKTWASSWACKRKEASRCFGGFNGKFLRLQLHEVYIL